MNLTAPLLAREFDGYLKRRLPHDLDQTVERIVDKYHRAPPTEQQAALAELRADAAAVLAAYGQRVAALAVRSQSIEALERGVVAVGMADGALEDWRDNLYPLAALNHAALALGTTLEAVVASVEVHLSRPALNTIRSFLNSSDQDRSLQAMGLGAYGSGDDFRYGSA